LAFAAVFIVLGGVLFAFGLPTVSGFGPLYFELAAALVLILAPITGVIAGSRLQAKQAAT
jgi:hypothetical protein